MSLKNFWTAAALSLTVSALAAADVTPMWGRYYLAAGLGEAAFKDGAFAQAAFDGPQALAVSKDGSYIYVADTGNDAVRRVALDQGSKVDTLAGSPGGAAIVSPTALALSMDGTSLFVVDGKQQAVKRIPAAGGSPEPVPVKLTFTAAAGAPLSPSAGVLPATALVRNGAQDVLYAWHGPSGSLYALEIGTGKTYVLGRLPELAGSEGTLACTNRHLYLLLNGSGDLIRFMNAGQGVAQGWNTMDQPVKLSWERVGVFGPGARGITAIPTNPDQWSLWIWDESRALFKVVDSQSAVVSEYPLRDYQGVWLGPSAPAARAPFADDPAPAATKRPLLTGPLGLVADPDRQQIYAAEANGNRVVGLGYPDWGIRRDDNLADYQCGAKVPGVTRILVVGDSMVLQNDLSAGEHPVVESGFGSQLETYLNFFSALKGKNRRFQVLQRSVVLGELGGGVTSYLADLPGELKALNPDEVITLMTYMNVNCELLSMGRIQTPDDIPPALYGDPQFFQQTHEEMVKNFGPLHRDFLAWLAKAPADVKQWVSVGTGSSFPLVLPQGPYVVGPLEDPGYRAWAMKVQAKVVKKAAEFARKNKMRYIQVLLPMRNQLAPGENIGGGLSAVNATQGAWADADLAKIAAGEGVEFINLTQAMRVADPTLFPLVAYGIHHYRNRGLEWAAMAAAWQYVENLP
jgi:hypothetical protein